MNATTDNCLIIFCRAPELGRVKRRLATRLGDHGALDAYCELVSHTLKQVGTVCAVKVLAVTSRHPQCDLWAEEMGAEQVLQVDGSLGKRMAAAMAEQFDSGFSKVLLIGVDLANLDAGKIQQGFTCLDDEQIDVVFAPAEDGGYGLVGSRRLLPELFSDDMPWGEQTLLGVSQRKCRTYGLNEFLLPVVWDVDEYQDWQRFSAARPVGCPPGGPESE